MKEYSHEFISWLSRHLWRMAILSVKEHCIWYTVVNEMMIRSLVWLRAKNISQLCIPFHHDFVRNHEPVANLRRMLWLYQCIGLFYVGLHLCPPRLQWGYHWSWGGEKKQQQDHNGDHQRNHPVGYHTCQVVVEEMVPFIPDWLVAWIDYKVLVQKTWLVVQKRNGWFYSYLYQKPYMFVYS